MLPYILNTIDTKAFTILKVRKGVTQTMHKQTKRFYAFRYVHMNGAKQGFYVQLPYRGRK